MPRRKATDHFELLPFIAILMCVLGCLLLVTMSIAALQIGPGAGEGWIPTNTLEHTAKIPILIEWDGKSLRIHREDRVEVIQWLEPRTIEVGGEEHYLKRKATDDPPLVRFLDDCETNKATHYALFAVRPSGFKEFDLMASDFREREVDIGYEPIAQTKSVRLLLSKPAGPANGKQP